MPIEIVFADSRWKRIASLDEHITKAHALAFTKRDKVKLTSLRLSNDKEIKILNRNWRGKNKATNVLSFPAGPQRLPSGEMKMLGDVILSYDTCIKEAKAAGKTLRDHAVHLVIHGLLHLVGQDHVNEADAVKMEKREIRILAKLGIANPYVLEGEP